MLKINDLMLKGFKGNPGEVEFKFSDFNQIIGCNGSGKTTIGEGIIWCLFGCDMFGNDKNSKNLLNNTCEDMSVSANISINNSIYNINRTYNGSISLYLNNKKTTQKKLSELLKGISKELFIVMFNPVYITNLAPSKARELLISILPSIPKSYILEVSGLKGIIDLIDNNLDELSSRKKILDNELLKIQGARDTLKSLTTDSNLSNISIDKIDKKISELKSKLITENKLMELQAELSELNSSRFVPSIDISDLRLELNTLDFSIDQIVNKANELKDLTNSNNGKCPLCHQAISKTTIESIILSLRKDYLDLDKQKKSLEQSIIQLKTFISNEEQSFTTNIELKRRNLLTQIEIFKKSNNNSTINSNLELLYQQKADKKVYDDQVNEINRLIKNESAYKEELLEIETKISATKHYHVARAEHIASLVSTKDMHIELFDIVKSTGELKPTFKLAYKNKPIDFLSFSERIKVGIEFAKVIHNIYSDNIVPMFIDNSETILEIPHLSCQVFLAKVKNQALSII